MSSFESSTVELGQERAPQFERLLTSISHHFLRLEAANLEVGIVGALRSICEATGADRAALLEIASNGSRKIASAHTYSDDEVSWTPNGIKGQSIEQMGWLADRLLRHEITHITSKEDLPPSAETERGFFESQRLQSAICVPLISDNALQAITCFAATEEKPDWQPAHIAFFQGATEILGSAIHRLRTELELAASREWLELSHRAGHSTAWEWAPEDDSITFSSTTAEVFGVPAEVLPQTGTDLLEFIPEADHEQISRTFKRVFSTGEPYEIEHRFEVPEKGTVWALVRGLVQKDAEGRVVKVVGVSADITKRKLAEQELQRAKEHAQVTLSSISDGVVRTDAAGRIDFLNPSAERLLGIRLEQVQGQMLSRFYRSIAADARTPKPNVVEECLSSRHVMEPAEASLLVLEDGSELAVRESAAPIIAENGDLVGAVLVFTNVTQLRSLQRRMEHLASHDPLTGLINRREFELRLADAITDAANILRQHILCYLDLDEFKVVNDTCGHAAGDELLKQLSRLLRREMPANGSLARLGGDEFGILIEDTSLAEARETANQLLHSISAFTFQWQERRFDVGVSIGMVPIHRDTPNASFVLSAADVACYVAKESGRNRVHVYEESDIDLGQRHSEMHWVSGIKEALEEDRFVLYRQEITALTADETTPHYELLLRMRARDGDIIPPGAFIPAAERYNLMNAVDRWVIDTAFRCLNERQHRGDNSIYSINLSGNSINDDGFPDYVQQKIDQYRIRTGQLCFELTETAAVFNLHKASHMIHTLKRLGCRFSLDDFGSGLSSFGYLKNLPVDFLKIDGSFVKDMNTDPMNRAIVEAIHQVGHTLSIRTIAEFVENQDIVDHLRDIGVDFGQGYHFSRPEPLDNSA